MTTAPTQADPGETIAQLRQDLAAANRYIDNLEDELALLRKQAGAVT